MSRYRTISVKMWGDERFSRLSRPCPNAQTLWIYLLTGPHTTALPGVFIAGEAGLAEALAWPIKAFRKAFGEIFDEGMIKSETRTRLLFIPKALKHNPPQSPNVVIAWRKAFDELPDCPLKQVIYETCITELTGLGKGEAFGKAFGKAFIYTFAESEQEQEQEQEQNQMGNARKTRPPEEFPITDLMREWLGTNQITADPIEEMAHMLDHYRGIGESRLDWQATWRTWMRNSKKFNRNGKGHGHKPKDQLNAEAGQRVLARMAVKNRERGDGDAV